MAGRSLIARWLRALADRLDPVVETEFYEVTGSGGDYPPIWDS